MVRMYCAGHHRGVQTTAESCVAAAGSPNVAGRGSPLCEECAALLEYASRKVDACPFGEGKPTCARCTVHCFRPEMRERIRAVMRYSGPRMTLRHPYLALRHLLDRRAL